MLVAELIEQDEETDFLGYVRRNHLELFPLLPTQSRYNRRRRALGEAANAIRRTLSARLLEVLGLEYALIDSLPIGVVNFAHSKQAHRWYGHAEYGFNASKQETVYGFRLHVLMTQSGLVLDYALLPANVADIHVAPQLLRCERYRGIGRQGLHQAGVAAIPEGAR